MYQKATEPQTFSNQTMSTLQFILTSHLLRAKILFELNTEPCMRGPVHSRVSRMVVTSKARAPI
jgi:hypothetical protein